MSKSQHKKSYSSIEELRRDLFSLKRKMSEAKDLFREMTTKTSGARTRDLPAVILHEMVEIRHCHDSLTNIRLNMYDSKVKNSLPVDPLGAKDIVSNTNFEIKLLGDDLGSHMSNLDTLLQVSAEAEARGRGFCNEGYSPHFINQFLVELSHASSIKCKWMWAYLKGSDLDSPQYDLFFQIHLRGIPCITHQRDEGGEKIRSEQWSNVSNPLGVSEDSIPFIDAKNARSNGRSTTKPWSDSFSMKLDKVIWFRFPEDGAWDSSSTKLEPTQSRKIQVGIDSYGSIASPMMTYWYADEYLPYDGRYSYLSLLRRLDIVENTRERNKYTKKAPNLSPRQKRPRSRAII